MALAPTPVNKRRATAAAIATLIAVPCEGIRQWAYYDPPNILTVCMGHTGPDVIKGRKYSMDECKFLLTADMAKAVAIVDTCVPNLPPNVLAAFSDATFNIGRTIACDRERSTAARYLLAGKYVAACNELPKWNRARVAGNLIPLPGLTKRRALELKVCLEGIS